MELCLICGASWQCEHATVSAAPMERQASSTAIPYGPRPHREPSGDLDVPASDAYREMLEKINTIGRPVAPSARKSVLPKEKSKESAKRTDGAASPGAHMPGPHDDAASFKKHLEGATKELGRALTDDAVKALHRALMPPPRLPTGLGLRFSEPYIPSLGAADLSYTPVDPGVSRTGIKSIPTRPLPAFSAPPMIFVKVVTTDAFGVNHTVVVAIPGDHDVTAVFVERGKEHRELRLS